ncbi:MAG TPA: nucleotidyltransferase domain-containing protein [Blastocatellia bacterium]|nr:nucleotidyltransferase domain-containing protein [Blastocatellia bacterium]
MKMEGQDAARAFVATHFPNCLAAVLFGSVARGEATPTSDLDIIIVTHEDIIPYRKSYREHGWFIEAFVGGRRYNEEKIRDFQGRHIPSFLSSYAEGVILKDQHDFARDLQEKAIAILERGPDELTRQEIDTYRYVITDWLDDFIDSKSYEESLFIAYDLVAKVGEFLLAYNRKWLGERKGLYRALRKLDHELSDQMIEELKSFYQTGGKEDLIGVVVRVLDLVGGKLYEGYSRADTVPRT